MPSFTCKVEGDNKLIEIDEMEDGSVKIALTDNQHDQDGEYQLSVSFHLERESALQVAAGILTVLMDSESTSELFTGDLFVEKRRE